VEYRPFIGSDAAVVSNRPVAAPAVGLGLHDVIGMQLLLNILNASFALDPGCQPAADIAAAGDRRKIVETRKEAELRQCLQDAQIEGRAADAAAGECEADSVVLQDFAAEQPHRFYLRATRPTSILGVPGCFWADLLPPELQG